MLIYGRMIVRRVWSRERDAVAGWRLGYAGDIDSKDAGLVRAGDG
ncbi:hypothetical protein NST07_03370 [Paenibacillus sp. FSL L8-0340]